jgi:DNA-binding PadR family transcriptional regulator
MFQLSFHEVRDLRSQIVTSNEGRGGRRHLPYAFTEQGVAMLSTVLNSERAVQMNIEIMRAFVRLRQILFTNKALAAKFAELERRVESHDEHIRSLFEAIRQLMAPEKVPHRRIGFRREELK